MARIRKWTTDQKMEIVLEHIRANTPLRHTAYKHDVDTSTLSRWHHQFLESARQNFENDFPSEPPRQTRDDIQTLRYTLEEIRKLALQGSDLVESAGS